MRYIEDMARSLHVRLDDDTAAAFEIVRAGCRTDSEAVRIALREAAARRRTGSYVRAEVARLNDDPADRAEKQAILDVIGPLAMDVDA